MRLLILGTGGMANNHATYFSEIPGVELVAAVDVDDVVVRGFALRHNIPLSFTSLDDAIAWGEFDAAANVTPDAIHHPTSLKLLAAGKHVFCEKPLAENYAKAAEMADAAEKAGLIAMVNLTYRNVAPLQAAREMVLAGKIGKVRHLEASYLQSWLVSKAWGDWMTESKWLWRLSTKHGSNGVLGDVGIHILDFASYGAGSDVERIFTRLKTFDKYEGNKIGVYDLDANDSFTMTAELENGAMGVIHASRWATGHLNELRLRIHGDKGALEVIHTPDYSSLRACIGEDVEKAIWKTIDVDPVPTNYEKFARAVMEGGPADPDSHPDRPAPAPTAYNSVPRMGVRPCSPGVDRRGGTEHQGSESAQATEFTQPHGRTLGQPAKHRLGDALAAGAEEGVGADHHIGQLGVERLSQPASRAVQAGLHRLGPDAEVGGGLLDRELLDLAQDEDQPERFGQVVDGAFQDATDLGAGGVRLGVFRTVAAGERQHLG